MKLKWLVMAVVLVTTGLLLFLFADRRPDNADAFMKSLYRFDNDSSIARMLANIREPSTLKEIFYACEKEKKHEVHYLAQEQVLYRLADMHDDASAKVLVELLSDRALRWDTEYAFFMYEALVSCGQPCVPYLKTLSEPSRLAREALAAIEDRKASSSSTQSFDKCPVPCNVRAR